MSRTVRSNTKATYDRDIARGRGRNAYVYGSVAPKVVPKAPERPQRRMPDVQPHVEVRKNREKAHHMSAGYVLFLITALCAAGIILVNYIQLQAELSSLTKAVVAAEAELNTMKVANDEEYNRIVNSINLEEIRQIAVGELGMVYAKEGQIIMYENEGNDYMRRVTQDNQ